MSKHHVVITGTGRAGTTFLVQLLTQLGLDTGFAHPFAEVYSNCNAGMEWDLRAPDAPYVVKSPYMCDYLDPVLTSGQVTVDHAFVPMRNLFDAAESRRLVTARNNPAEFPDGIPGGLWHTQVPAHQEMALTLELYKVMHALARHDVPTTLLDFPRFVRDPEYLYRKLQPLLIGIDAPTFVNAFKAVARPDLVHRFVPASRPQPASA